MQYKKSSIIRKILLPLLGVIILQAIIYYATITQGGTISLLENNSIHILNQNASKRKLSLENAMVQNWSNLDSFLVTLEEKTGQFLTDHNASISDLQKNKDLSRQWMQDAAAVVLPMQRQNNTSGSFIILNNNDNENYGGIYFRDQDPTTNLQDYSDIMMMRGSISIAQRLNIPVDSNWEPSFKYDGTDESMPYFFEPFQAAQKNPGLSSKNLGFWSSPFYLNDSSSDNNKIITYSMPLIYDDGTPYGVIGVEISINELSSMLPNREIDDNNRGGYILISYDKDADMNTVECTIEQPFGSSVHKSLDDQKTVTFSKASNSNFYKLDDIEMHGEALYGVIYDLKLYNTNTPFSGRQWAVAAVANDEALFGIADKLRINVLISTGIAMAAGILVILLVSNAITNPIRRLVDKLQNSEPDQQILLEKAGIREIDEISEVIEDLSRKQEQNKSDLLQERERYLVALESTADNIIEYDIVEDFFLIYNFIEKDGKSALKNHSYAHFKELVLSGNICQADDIEQFVHFLEGRQEEIKEFRLRIPEEAAGYHWFSAKGKTIKDSSGKIIRIIGNTKDITKAKEQEFAEKEKNKRDAVTKLYKREIGEEKVRNYLAKKPEAESFCICLIDMDDFQKLNNHFGLLLCDILLEETAEIMKRLTKATDILYRLGGDEFMIALPDTDIESARTICQNISDEINLAYPGEDGELSLGLSIAIVHSDKETNYDCLFAEAARTLLTGKSLMKGQITIAAIKNGNMIPINWRPNEIVSRFYDADDDIVSIAFNIFEKTNDVKNTVPVLFGKLGRQFKLFSITVTDSNQDFCTEEILFHWKRSTPDPKLTNITHYTEEAYQAMGSGFQEDGEKLTVTSEAASYICAMYDNGCYSGSISFTSDDPGREWTPDEKTRLKEIVKIISAHISRSKSDSASRAKSEFLSRMSHEIRTPMNGIIGMTAIARSMEDAAPKMQDCLSKIDTSAKFLLSLINNILDMSRIESGKLHIDHIPFDLNEVVRELDVLIRPQIEGKKQNLIINTKVKNKHLCGDPLKLSQVLINILGNAVKFTNEAGSIYFTVEQVSQEEESAGIRFSIRDTGIGISKENTIRIFKAFEQAENDTLRKFGGTGLGLAISSNLVRMMGGRLEIESELGAGTDFYFTLLFPISNQLPQSQNPTVTSAPAEKRDFSDCRLLLVEDNELNIEIAKTILESMGFSIELAVNGQEAVDMFELSETGYYSAVLMDIRMPVMDGLEATRRIRTLGKGDSRTVPIIAMTANAFDEDMNKSIESGMNGHLSKPIDLQKLYEVLDREIP